MVYRSCRNCFWNGLCYGCDSACKDHIRMDELDKLPKGWGNPTNHPLEETANKLRELGKYY